MNTKKRIVIAFLVLFNVITFAQTNTTLEFVGNANIQKSLSNSDEIPTITGIGVIYREYLYERSKALHSIEIELTLNIAFTVDTLKTVYDASNNVTNKSEFGNSILLPSNSGLGTVTTGKLITQEENSELRRTFLGSDRTSFLGFKANLGLRLRNIET